MALRMRSLQRATLPSHLLDYPSPAYPYSRRLAVHIDNEGSLFCTAYFASGIHLYGFKVPLSSAAVQKGKEDLLVPAVAQSLETWALDQYSHRAEIQSVALTGCSYDGGLMLGSVDSYGCLMVNRLDVPTQGYTVVPQDAGVGEGSWAGLAFAEGQPTLAVVARGFAKTIDVYDKDIHVRTLRTLQQPAALTFLRGGLFGTGFSSTFAVAGGPQLTVWDLRVSERGGLVQTVVSAYSGHPLYALSSSCNGLLAAGGACRTATVIDPRRWSASARWTNCLKYEIMGLSFSAVSPNHLYVHGLDYETVCGRWNPVGGEMGQLFGFRGDSRWLSMETTTCSKAKSDVLVGWCESGSVFVGECVQQPGG